MARTAAEVDPQLITFVLPGLPESVRIARSHVRSALDFHGLAEFGEDAELVISELVTNAVQHACGDGLETIGITLTRAWKPPTVTVVVSDCSFDGAVLRDASPSGERGRGLQIVKALSAGWGWREEKTGKAVFAVLAQKA